VSGFLYFAAKLARKSTKRKEKSLTEDKQMASQTIADPIVRDQAVKDQKVQAVQDQKQIPEKKKPILSLDGWAVAIALGLAALVRLGILKHVAW
jgi:hypothetical protein